MGKGLEFPCSRKYAFRAYQAEVRERLDVVVAR